MTREEALFELVKSAEIILGDQSFVAMIHRDDDEFIQLCAAKTIRKDGSPGRPAIAIDRPLEGISDEHDERARKFYALHGVNAPASVPCQFADDKGNAGPMGMTKAWMIFAHTPEEAATLAIEAFEAIFQPPAWPEYDVFCFEGILVD